MDAGGCEMIGALLVSLALQGQPTLLTSEPPSIVAALTHETVEIREDFTVHRDTVIAGFSELVELLGCHGSVS